MKEPGWVGEICNRGQGGVHRHSNADPLSNLGKTRIRGQNAEDRCTALHYTTEKVILYGINTRKIGGM